MKLITHRTKILLWALMFSFLLRPLNAKTLDIEHNALKLPAHIHTALSESLNLLYHLKFEEGLARIKKVEYEAENHPLVSFAIASAYWWRLSVYVLEHDPEESKPFLEAIDRCIAVSEKAIKKGDPYGEAHLALGGALGIWGRFEATNQNWFSAYFKGKKAYKILRKGFEINPILYDVNMGLGMFDYYVATLPKVVQVLAFLGVDADREKGLEELMLAAFKSHYAQVPSRFFLVDIYTNQENEPAKAREILQTMRDDYPNSPFVHMLEVITLYNLGDKEELKTTAYLMLERLESGLYDASVKTQTYFSMGMVHFQNKEWQAALNWFNKAISAKQELQSFYSWATLYKGYALDALGRRDEAEVQYKAVLSQLRRWHSYDNAKKRLKTPFGKNENEPELTKLIL